ncbi:IMP-specific 5'-nucleotidase 1 [Neoconidiobolus thromboides FSU 785]|nr:IMP-specific 5'-nucleotidase 1 [Neoconidiobolus thromboides FSU 785]
MSSIYRVNYQLRAHKRDPFIEFIKSMLMTPFVLHSRPRYEGTLEDEQRALEVSESNEEKFAEILKRVEVLVEEHRKKTEQGIREHSRLHRLVPSVGNFFTDLPLKEAFLKVNAQQCISARRFVPPSFNEIRKILNVAQVQAVSNNLKLVTFDGDMTLYADGQDFEQDSELVSLLISLLEKDLFVAVVTAAGYGDDSIKYEGRLSGLLKGFSNSRLTPEQLKRFFVFGGECNYLFQCNENCRLEYIKESIYLKPGSRDWSEDHIKVLLDSAEQNIRRCTEEMKLPTTILRKSRAVGLIPQTGKKVMREQLDECVLSTQSHLLETLQVLSSKDNCSEIPFCAFNGGSDVWVDIGNKLIGVKILQSYLDAKPEQTLHFGDQFLSTGNDYATRSACCTSWIVSPEETQEILILLLTGLLK